MTFFYCYPVDKSQSFTLISERHISYLQRYMKVKKWDVDYMKYLINLKHPSVVFLHPIGYPFLGTSKVSVEGDFWEVRDKVPILLGEDVSDTDQISEKFVNILNAMDGVVCNSEFTYEIFRKCGVKSPMTVVSNGLYPEFYRKVETQNPDLIELRKIAQGKTLMLFFLLHSPIRKGYDLLLDAMKKVNLDDLILVIKTPFDIPKVIPNQLNMVGFYSMEDIVALYDIVDFVVVPSRGGSFELNVIEALARGKPVITPDEGCFKEFLKWTIPVKTERWVPVFSSENPVHIGKGPQVNVNDLAETIVDVYENLDCYSIKAMDSRREVLEKYSWDKVCSDLYNFINKYI